MPRPWRSSRRRRVTLDVEGICRTAAKEFLFSASNLCAKGKGAAFFAWCITNHPRCVVYVPPRADLGTWLDSWIDVALALYMNRRPYLEWLEVCLAGIGAERKLETYLYTLLSLSEVLAAIRARAIFHLKVVRPMRFL